MTRAMTGGMATAINAERGEQVHLIELGFETPVHLCTASQDLDWNTETWWAIGGALEIGTIVESGDLSSSGFSLTLGNVDQTVLALLLNQKWVGNTVTAWRAPLDPATGLFIEDPLFLTRGRMNGGWEVSENGSTSTVSVRCTDLLAELDQRRGIQTNPGSHSYTIRRNDGFFRHVGELANANVIWKA